MNALAEPPLLTDETGLVRRFLSFLPRAEREARAAAVNALARAYLHCDLKPETRADAEIALTRALDDPEPSVRRALSEAFADARAAPRHIVLALAVDISAASRPVLAQSPLLSVADLVDCVAVGDAAAQTAIARRARLGSAVAAAIAEIGERPAALALIGNLDADIGTPALWRLFERFQVDAELRARLAERPGLPAALRAAVAAATTADISDMAADWLDPRRAERIARDGREQAFVAIASECAGLELAELAVWLRAHGHLTVGLLLRALCSADTKLLQQALAEMSGLPAQRVEGLARDARGQGFGALYARAGMPAHLLPAFRIAAGFATQAGGAGVGVDYALTMKTLRAIEALDDPALAPVVAMLWRLAGEAARADARDFAEHALAPEALESALAPIEIESAAPPVLLLNVEPGNENFAPLVTLDLPEPIVVAA